MERNWMVKYSQSMEYREREREREREKKKTERGIIQPAILIPPYQPMSVYRNFTNKTLINEMQERSALQQDGTDMAERGEAK